MFVCKETTPLSLPLPPSVFFSLIFSSRWWHVCSQSQHFIYFFFIWQPDCPNRSPFPVIHSLLLGFPGARTIEIFHVASLIDTILLLLSAGTYRHRQQFAVGEMCGNVVRFGAQGLLVPVFGLGQLVQPHVGLSCWGREERGGGHWYLTQ